MSDNEDTWVSMCIDSRGREILVREWRPGDGTDCSHRHYRRKLQCGAPVALLLTINPNPGPYAPARVIRRVCASHLVQTAINDYRSEWNMPAVRQRAEKAAREAVIAAHWDEYAAESEARIEQALAEQLAQLPEFVRKIFTATDWEKISEEAVRG